MSRARWFDSHCHVQDNYRPQDTGVPDVLEAALEAGVEGLVCVGTDRGSSLQALTLARQDRHRAPVPGVWATVGLHPHEASLGVQSVADLVEEAVSVDDGALVAVGECGLDYHYDHSPRPDQREAFAAQVALARRYDLALVVHTREAWDDTVDLLRPAQGQRVVVHCFSGGPDQARRFLDLGACLSFSGLVTFANALEVRQAAELCPLDRLMIETDAPFLAPVPHRGRPNQPAYVGVVGEAVAAVKGLAVEELAESTTAVARRLFALA